MKGCEYLLLQCTTMTNQNTMTKCIGSKDHHNGKPDYDSLKGRWTLEELGFTSKKRIVVGAREKMSSLEPQILLHWLKFKFTQTLVCVSLLIFSPFCVVWSWPMMCNEHFWIKKTTNFSFIHFDQGLDVIHFSDVHKIFIQWKLFDH